MSSCQMCANPELFNVQVIHITNEMLRHFVNAINDNPRVDEDGYRTFVEVSNKYDYHQPNHLDLLFRKEVVE